MHIMSQESHSTEPSPRRGVYLLPNLFTTAGLFAAFYAIVMGMKGQYENAAMAIFVAMIADALDGRIARLTNTQTAFGAEYDSLADMVSFGVAPALVLYSWSLASLGKVGWLVAFIYTAAGALRLARFNTQVGIADKRYFQGLAIPSAAAITAGMVWLGVDRDINGHHISLLVALITFVVAILMVSNVRYYSFKTIDVKGRLPFIAGLVIVLLFVAISVDPPLILFSAFFIYGLSGPVMTLRHKYQKRRVKVER
ncbi:MAG: CDP-diacylglycerol--serine O-phosphatidyltransferase [Gammaproteobacteria bacterium]